MKFILFIMLALAPAAIVNAADPEWYYIATDVDDTEVSARYSDLLKGRSDQTTARVWVKSDHSKDKTTDARETKTFYEVNCPARTFKALSRSTLYPGNTSPDVDEYPFGYSAKNIVPETVMESVADALCLDPSND